LLRSAIKPIDLKSSNDYLIAPLGTSQDSSALVCYSLFKDLFTTENEALDRVIEITQLEEKLNSQSIRKLILIDDNITSGTQLSEFFNEIFTIVDSPEIIKKPLSESSKSKLRELEIYVCYAIKLTEECDIVIEKIKETHSINLKVLYGTVDYNNYTEYSSPLINSIEESDYAKKVIEKRSLPLYQDKNWDKVKLYDRLYGYGNLGKLTVFSHNVPKSLIPFFWKSGKIDGRHWMPLFPERQEYKKIESKSLGFDPFLLEFASSISDSSSIIREPEISLEFDPVFGTTEEKDELILDILDEETLERVFSKVKIKKYRYTENLIYPHQNNFRSFSSFRDIEEREPYSIDEENYEYYKRSIDALNNEYEKYKKELCRYLQILSSQGKINLYFENKGIGAANNLRFKFSYNTTEILFIEPKEMLKPHCTEIEPLPLKEFEYGNREQDLTELFTEIDFKGEVSGRPIKDAPGIVSTFSLGRLSHKGTTSRIYKYLILDRDIEVIQIRYKVLWDESIEGIEGVLKIKIRKTKHPDSNLGYLYQEIE